MTDKQAHLVRDLRQYESPVCMEAAREIERLEGKLSDKASSLADAERKIERLESRIFDLEVELEQTS